MYIYIYTIHSLIIDECGSVLNEIIKAKENIKRKYNELKSYETDTLSYIEHALKPIIDSLTPISKLKTNNFVLNESKSKKIY